MSLRGRQLGQGRDEVGEAWREEVDGRGRCEEGGELWGEWTGEGVGRSVVAGGGVEASGRDMSWALERGVATERLGRM